MVVALIALLILLAIFGGLGFAVHILWILLIAALIIWALGFLFRSASGGGRWYRW